MPRRHCTRRAPRGWGRTSCRSSTRRRCGCTDSTACMAERDDETRARIVAVPEEIAANADEVAALAESVRAQLRSSVAGDAEAAAELARAAGRVARRLAELNEA